jgi:ferredoxin
MHQVLVRITDGNGREGDIELLERLAHYVKSSSLCMLGGTAPNPVLSTLRYFRDEYEAHIRDQRCPAGVCKPLVTFRIDAEACKGCTLCAKNCPSDAIAGERKQPHLIDPVRCVKCGVCYEECPFDAVVTE